jgi:hypothetical protein
MKDRLMDILDKKNDTELLESVVAEAAKASNELNCAQNDIKKAKSRLSFLVVLANELIKRKGD